MARPATSWEPSGVVPSRRSFLSPRHGLLNVLHVLATHAGLIACLGFAATLYWVAYLPFVALVCLVHQRAMSEWIHEAGHWNLFADKRWNDRLGDALAGVWFGLPVASYRATHFVHHDRDGFFLAGDEDTVFLTVGTRRAFWWAVARDVTGLTAVRQYLRFRTGVRAPGSRGFVVFTAALHLTALAVLFHLGRLDAWVAYAGTLLLLYPLLNRLRTYGQHVTIGADGRAQFVGSPTSRTIDGGLIDRVVWTSARLLYHHEHHRHPHLPYRALRGVCSPSDDVNRYSTSRWAVLRSIYAGLA
jgi:fatty acid desaturase